MALVRRCLFVLIVLAALTVGGCWWSPARGPSYWWDDEKQQRMSEDYRLPAPPAAQPHEATGTTRGEPALRQEPPAPLRAPASSAGVVPRGE